MRRTLAVAAAGVVAAGVLAAAMLLGPDLLDSRRFVTELDRHVEVGEADVGTWPQVQETCSFCHGPRGQSSNGQYPALAGLSLAYLETQLRAFASDQRPSPTMGPLVKNLTDGQIQRLAAYYSLQKPRGSPDGQARGWFEERGKAVVQALNCQACHGAGLTGKDPAPRLAGQGETYLASQLAAFSTGRRHDPTGAMTGVAAALPNEDIPALAHYLSRIPPGTDVRWYRPDAMAPADIGWSAFARARSR
jgi:cytochrome c553